MILYDKFHKAEFARDDLVAHLTKLYPAWRGKAGEASNLAREDGQRRRNGGKAAGGETIWSGDFQIAAMGAPGWGKSARPSAARNGATRKSPLPAGFPIARAGAAM